MRVAIAGILVWLALSVDVAAAPFDGLCTGVTAGDGICEVFEKPEERDVWGDLYARFVEPQNFRHSIALVVGVGRYTGYRALEAPVHDAQRVRDFLVHEAGFDIVITLTDKAASKQRIERLMEDGIPRQLGTNDRFLFYFSGHGETRELFGSRKRGYLVLTGAPEKTWSQMVGMDGVEDWAENIAHARQSLWVLDACFSGLAGTQRRSPLTDKRASGWPSGPTIC